jgi:hypothetical protein
MGRSKYLLPGVELVCYPVCVTRQCLSYQEQESFEHIRYLLPPEPGILTLRETGGVGQAEKGGWVPTWRDEWMDGWMDGWWQAQ